MNESRGPEDAWGEAMNRDFDARVRNLHEAPLNVDGVKRKAGTIRRNRRVAVAGGVAAVIAVVAPTAVFVSNGSGNADGVQPAGAPTADPAAAKVDFLAGRTWHRADGDAVTLDATYDSAVIWDGQLVATRGDAASTDHGIVDVIDVKGEEAIVVDTFETNAQPVVVNDDRSTLAYVTPDKKLMTRWADDTAELASGLRSEAAAAGIRGGPACGPGTDCAVFVNNPEPAGCQQHGSGRIFQPAPNRCNDATEGLMTVLRHWQGEQPCTEVREATTNTVRWQDL